MENSVIEEIEDTDEISKEDQNRLEILCKNVSNCVVHLQNSHSELLEFKSILLSENIAPSVLVKLSIINGNIFRNLSDLHNPLGELIRLVRVYSEPWEMKSKSLRKLHKDYEKKAANLNIALKKLARQNEESKRIKRQEILQNWELLFTRLQMNRNHGRRWKYRMFEFKVKAEQGIENLQNYFQQLFDEDSGINVKKTQILEQQSDVEYKPAVQNVKSILEITPIEDLENVNFVEDQEYQESLEEEEYVKSPEPIETIDASVGTSDLNFSQVLVMRIYQPKDFQLLNEFGFRIIYGNNTYQTYNFNKCQEIEEETKIETKELDVPSPNFSQPGKPKGGLIGRRKNKPIDLAEKATEEIKKGTPDNKLSVLENIKEVKIPIPNDVSSEMKKDNSYHSIKVLLFSNDDNEKSVGQVTMDLEELKDLDLQIFQENIIEDNLTPTPNTSINSIPFPNLEPMSFPIYTYQDLLSTQKSTIQIGQLPIACFYSRKEDQIISHKATDMQTINRLVEELTGINLDAISKEELTREKFDVSVSPIQANLQVSEKQAELDAIKNKYEDEIKSIHQFYENKMKELLEINRISVEKELVKVSSTYHKDCATSPINEYKYMRRNKLSSKSRDTLSTSEPDNLEESRYLNFEQDGTENENNNIFNVNFNLPDNFHERLSLFSEQSNMQNETHILNTRSEIKKTIENKIPGIYIVRDELVDDVSLAVSDMCLPAIFMPFTNAVGTIYNPRAHQYFHPIGLKYARISQPASILKLPPIRNNQLSVLNLFQIGNEMQIKSFDIKNNHRDEFKK